MTNCQFLKDNRTRNQHLKAIYVIITMYLNQQVQQSQTVIHLWLHCVQLSQQWDLYIYPSIAESMFLLVSGHPPPQKVYTHLLPKSILASLPKAWRINLILETVYGAWTLTRTTTKLVFTNSKTLQYVALLNLLDNYLPLVLSIYTITFKRNDFLQYRSAMIRVWVMFVCLERRHYNKSPLVWLSCNTHWETNFPQLYNLWKKWPTIFDEYPVENTHSILQAQTHQSDTAEQLTKKAKIILVQKNVK